MHQEFELVSTEKIFARLSEELSTYSNNNLLDTGKLFPQIKWFCQILGLSVFQYDEVVLNLNNHRAELPCSFFLLDSAWLCSGGGLNSDVNTQHLNFQSKLDVYTERVYENIINKGNCYLPDTNNLYPVSISIAPCSGDKVLAHTITREYIVSDPTNGRNTCTFHHPKLLRLNNKKSVRSLCSKDCQNLFSHNDEEISISRQGGSYYLYSTLKNPIIYCKFYSFPISEDGLPMIPNDGIIEEALFWHLFHYVIQNLWLNGEVADVADKIKYLQEKKDEQLNIVKYYTKLPTFLGMKLVGDRTRQKFRSFEIMGDYRHY